ncbi:unnamed protein product [Rhizophagus irregularis]|uniref:Uncharacterized protein n=2 Tax=Rhizophagus irregularis TaxID=588596 RepID=A0A015MKF8_RHIIW|nr:hypothetical protein RirG_115340 [Rhizophagus irregularis DAOM 197198w]CAB5213792.1 unnamed protein product [Rhizophagus irregularis]
MQGNFTQNGFRNRICQRLTLSPYWLMDQVLKKPTPLNMTKNKMYANNVSSGNGTSATDIDVGIGQTSVALRVLYEYFTSGGNYDYGEFVKMCKNFEITISMALKGRYL